MNPFHSISPTSDSLLRSIYPGIRTYRIAVINSSSMMGGPQYFFRTLVLHDHRATFLENQNDVLNYLSAIDHPVQDPDDAVETINSFIGLSNFFKVNKAPCPLTVNGIRADDWLEKVVKDGEAWSIECAVVSDQQIKESRRMAFKVFPNGRIEILRVKRLCDVGYS